MKTIVWKRSLLLAAVLLLIAVLAVPAFAQEDQTVELPMEYPKMIADYTLPVRGTNTLSSYVDMDEFTAYIVSHMAKCESTIDISQFNIPGTDDLANELRHTIWYETPEAFHCFGLGVYQSDILRMISVSYRGFADTQEEYAACHEAFASGADTILDGIEGNSALSDVEKALLLHDRLAVWTEYSYADLLAGTLEETVYTAYGALGQQSAVCQGYAMAYMYLLDRVGIESDYCSSDALNHAWNIVYIDGKSYHVDVTWDDPVWDVTGRVYHDNFLRSTAGIIESGHDANDYTQTPADTTYDSYYWQVSNTAFQLIEGKLYYIDTAAEMIFCVEGTENREVWSVAGKWPLAGGYYYSRQAKLSSVGDKLLYSGPKAIYLLDPEAETAQIIFEPDLTVGEYFSIYGFKYEHGNLVCDLYGSPNYDEDGKDYQVVEPYSLPPAVTYTVIFKNWDGTVLSTETYNPGDSVVIPKNPVRPDDATYTYTFAGWDKEIVPVAGDAVYTATYKASVKPASYITSQPKDITVDSGETVQFTVGVSGSVVSWKWEYRKVWKWFDTSMTGYNTDTLTVAATGARNGYDYRCLVTFADGTKVYSEPAELTVLTTINILTHPKDQTVVLGFKGQFSAEADGESPSYQWQYKRPGSTLWLDTSMTGATKATVMIETTKARDGYSYRCRITDVTGYQVYTDVAVMRVLSYTKHPENRFAAVGSNAQFSVETSVSDGFTYQWQYRKNENGAWNNTTMPGYNTATLTVAATKARNGYQYRCIITGSKNSKLESKAATLYAGAPVVISGQPANVKASVGANVVFSVNASNAYSYQWQYRKNATASWQVTSMEGANTAVLTVPVISTRNGYQYRCVITGLNGQTYYSNPATLTVG